MKSVRVFVLTLALLGPPPGMADAYPTLDHATQSMETASQVFDRMFTDGLSPRERAHIASVLKEAHGFVVLPNVFKFGLGVSQIQGKGVLVFRDARGAWQAPLPLLISGQGVGPHFALIAYDALIPIPRQVSLEELLGNNLSFTGQDTIGPLQSYGSTSGRFVAYARGKGLSAGLAQDTLHITLDQQAIQALYGIHVAPHEIAGGKLENCRKPLPVQKLLEKANEFTAGAPITTILTPR